MSKIDSQLESIRDICGIEVRSIGCLHVILFGADRARSKQAFTTNRHTWRRAATQANVHNNTAYVGTMCACCAPKHESPIRWVRRWRAPRFRLSALWLWLFAKCERTDPSQTQHVHDVAGQVKETLSTFFFYFNVITVWKLLFLDLLVGMWVKDMCYDFMFVWLLLVYLLHGVRCDDNETEARFDK